MTKKILIAGFDPFAGDLTNPTSDWITWMKTRPVPVDREIKSVILPVTFAGAFCAFQKIYDEFCPTIVILTGLAKNRAELTVERIGINWVDARIPDNDGVTLSSQKIDPEGPDGLFTTLSIDEMKKLTNNAQAHLKLSTSAGEYVCNYLLYKTLCYTKNKNTSVAFIHFPGLDNYNGIHLALESIVNGL